MTLFQVSSEATRHLIRRLLIQRRSGVQSYFPRGHSTTLPPSRPPLGPSAVPFGLGGAFREFARLYARGSSRGVHLSTAERRTLSQSNRERLTMRCSELRALPFSYRAPAVGPTGSVTGCAARHEAPAQPAPSPRAAVLTAPASGPESLSLGSLGPLAP